MSTPAINPLMPGTPPLTGAPPATGQDAQGRTYTDIGNNTKEALSKMNEGVNSGEEEEKKTGLAALFDKIKKGWKNLTKAEKLLYITAAVCMALALTAIILCGVFLGPMGVAMILPAAAPLFSMGAFLLGIGLTVRRYRIMHEMPKAPRGVDPKEWEEKMKDLHAQKMRWRAQQAALKVEDSRLKVEAANAKKRHEAAHLNTDRLQLYKNAIVTQKEIWEKKVAECLDFAKASNPKKLEKRLKEYGG